MTTPGPLLAVTTTGTGNSGACFQDTVALADGVSTQTGQAIQQLASGLYVPARIVSRYRRTTNQAIASSSTVPVAISWDTEDADTLGLIAVPGTTFTIPTGKGGAWSFEFQGTISAAVVARHRAVCAVTSSIAQTSRTFTQTAYGEDTQHINVGPLVLAAADTVIFSVLQASGGSLNENPAWCSLTYWGP